MTRLWASALRVNPSYGPTTPASSAERRRRAGHQRGDGRGQRPATLGVVRVTGRHQQRTEVGVADAQLPEARVVSAIGWVGKSAKQMEMSIG